MRPRCYFYDMYPHLSQEMKLVIANTLFCTHLSTNVKHKVVFLLIKYLLEVPHGFCNLIFAWHGKTQMTCLKKNSDDIRINKKNIYTVSIAFVCCFIISRSYLCHNICAILAFYDMKLLISVVRTTAV